MRIRYIIILITFNVCVYAQNGYYFFDQQDIDNIKRSSTTAWGRSIVDSLKLVVENRRKHSLRVPLLEGGHYHHYFCPKHNVMFTFDWDKPHDHYCSFCDKYWKGNNRYDWAWINMLHAENLKYLTSCMYLHIITEETAYALYIRDMLLDYASKYPTYFEHNPNRVSTTVNSGRMFGQSLDEAVWASEASRAYLIAKPVMSTDEVKMIEDGYLSVCANMLLKRRGGGNWQVWHNSGLMALGITLGSDEVINTALNDLECGYYKLMEKHVYEDGWWNEGSPIYHYYPLRAMLLSAEAVRCRNINLYDKKLYNMLASPALGVYSNLSFPAHNDGWYGESLLAQVQLYEIAYLRYKDPFFLNILKQSYLSVRRDSQEALQNYIEIEPDKNSLSLRSISFKDVGFSVLRSGQKSVVMKYGPHGGGHGHPDKLSISIHDGSKELIPDMGTSAYGVPDFAEWYRKSLSHNTVVVDFKDQKKTTGKLTKFITTENGGIIEAECDSAYDGVKMIRKIEVNKKFIMDIFSAVSEEEHCYDYILILTEKPVFEYIGRPIHLGQEDAYRKISNTEIRNGNRSISIKTKSLDIRIHSLITDQFEIITGDAPGIPPRNPNILQSEFELKPCYPIIIRTKNKMMKIKAELIFRI